MNNQKVRDEIAANVDLLSTLAMPQTSSLHAQAVSLLLDHLRRLYRENASSFGVVNRERIQLLLQRYRGSGPSEGERRPTTQELEDAVTLVLSGAFPKSRSPLSASRTADCFKCRRILSSETLERCTRCGWIVCNCGACGCDFAGAAAPDCSPG